MSPDPFQHQQIERRFIDHVERLLAEERLRIDTSRGRRAINKAQAMITRGDEGVEVKRLMAAMGRPDRELQRQMPAGESISADFWQKKWGVFSKKLGRVRGTSKSPGEALGARRSALGAVGGEEGE